LAPIASENVTVAGDSTVLQWLVAACGRAAPWLRLEADAVVIDWQLLLHHKPMRDAPPLTALLALLPSLPLAIFNAAAQGSRDYSRLATIYAAYDRKTTPLPDSLRQHFSDVVTEGAALLPDLMDAQRLLATSVQDYSVLYSIGMLATELKKAVPHCDINAVSIYTQLQCCFDQRLLVAGGYIHSFLFGLDSGPFGPQRSVKPQDRLRVRRLARRLLRTNLEFLATLTALVQHGAPSGLPLLPLEAVESCQRLAQLERELFELISPRSPFSEAQASAFFTAKVVWSNIRSEVPEQNRWQHGRGYSEDRYTGGGSPLGRSIFTLNQLEHTLQSGVKASIEARCRGMKLAKLTRAVCAAHAEAKRFDFIMLQGSTGSPVPTSLVAGVASAIDWLIAKSPLLTLFASGVLQTYPLPADAPGIQAYGISLSAWLVASAVATKVLGSEPMTYIDATDGQSEEAEADDGERKAKATVTKPLPTGRLLWDLAQSSLA